MVNDDDDPHHISWFHQASRFSPPRVAKFVWIQYGGWAVRVRVATSQTGFRQICRRSRRPTPPVTWLNHEMWWGSSSSLYDTSCMTYWLIIEKQVDFIWNDPIMVLLGLSYLTGTACPTLFVRKLWNSTSRAKWNHFDNVRCCARPLSKWSRPHLWGDQWTHISVRLKWRRQWTFRSKKSKCVVLFLALKSDKSFIRPVRELESAP